MRPNHIGIVFYFLLSSLAAWSQEFNFQHITTVDGLSHNETRKIVKDSDGFLWFGTQNGLNRYDGYRFKVFKHNPNDSTTIIGDKVFSLTSSKNKLWVGTITGLSVVNTSTLEVTPSPNISTSIRNKEILQLFYDGLDKVWLSTEDENFIIDTESFDSVKILPDYKIACIANGYDEVLWIGTDKGLLLYDPKKSSIIKIFDIGQFSAYGLDEIFTNSFGEVWLTLGDKIFRYQPERDRFVEVYTSNSVNAIAEYKDKSIFFGSYGNGLLKYERKTGRFDEIAADPENHFTLSSNDVYDIYVDDENIIWVGTQEGLDYYDFSRHKFNRLVRLPNNDNSLRSSFVQAIFRDTDGIFWVGTREGVDQVTFDEGYTNPMVSHFDAKEYGFEELDNAYISCIYGDSKDRLWIATMSNGLFVHQKESNIFKHFEHNPENDKSIASSSIRSVMEDRSGRLWFGTGNGLSLLQEKDGDYSFENLGYSKYHTSSLPLNDVYSVFQDSKDRIWVGTNKGGLCLLQERGSGKSFLRFNTIPSDWKSLSNNDVFVIYEDTKHRMWFGTSGGGLNLLKEDGPTSKNKGYYFKRYTESDGLSDNEINSILEDGSGNLWLATNKGLSKFNLEEEIFTNFTTYDGVLKGKFRKNARWKTKDGTLFFGGAAGINFFNPDNFVMNETRPKPIFTSFSIDDREIKMGQQLDGTVVIREPLDSESVVTLPPRDNRFEINFATLSFASPYRNQYAYKLDGIDQDWKFTSGKNPHASYSKLPAGTHRFFLKSSNNDGVWSNKPAYLDIQVQASFFDSNLFRAGIILLMLTTGILGILVFKKFKKRKKDLRYSAAKIKRPLKPVDLKTDNENLEKMNALERFMTKEKLYLDADLGLNQLAEKLGVSANHLSMILNDYIGKNFYDYVNYFRVEEVKKRLKDPVYTKQTLSSIGGDCGFNSKSAFNRIFKNLTGKTPSQYQNETA